MDHVMAVVKDGIPRYVASQDDLKALYDETLIFSRSLFYPLPDGRVLMQEQTVTQRRDRFRFACRGAVAWHRDQWFDSSYDASGAVCEECRKAMRGLR